MVGVGFDTRLFKIRDKIREDAIQKTRNDCSLTDGGAEVRYGTWFTRAGERCTLPESRTRLFVEVFLWLGGGACMFLTVCMR